MIRTMGFVVLAAVLCPMASHAQVEVAAGLVVAPGTGPDGTQVGPLVAAAVSRDVLGLPLFLELGAARTDFTSLDQDYHNNHYLLAAGGEGFVTRGTTRLGWRLGVGAYGELQTVESDPPSPGGGGWIETVLLGVVLERELGSGRRFVVRLSDAVLGPWFAVLDPSEYSVEHRALLLIGLRF